MYKRVIIKLEKIKIERYVQESIPSNDEVLVMNYNDVIKEEGECSEFANIKSGDENTNIDIEHSVVKETIIAHKELKVEDEELCDVDTKENILLKFEAENVDDIGIEQNEEENQSNSDKTVICHQCGFRAKRKHHLLSHIQLAHKKGKKPQTDFQCEYCMFKSKYKPSLGLHMARFHMDEIQKNGSANSAPKKSCYETQGTILKEHSTLDKDNVYNCNYCSFTAPEEKSMFRHTVVHTVHKSKVKQCPQCPKKFTETVLSVHLSKEHHSDGVFKCPKCSYTAKWKNNIRRHMRKFKDKEICGPVQKRRSTLELAKDRSEGKAPPLKKRKTKDDNTE